MKRWMILMGLITVSFAQPVFAEVMTGQPAPDFTLTDSNGAAHTLSDYAGEFVVLEWVNYDCPFVKKHYDSGNMQGLQNEYTSKGVTWLAINSSAPGKQGNFTPEEINRKLDEKGSSVTAYLLDTEGHVGHIYGAQTTPHMYIINPEGVLIYQGAIDNKPSADPADIPSSDNYVRDAMEQAMNGEPVAVPETKSYGCSVKY